MIAATTVWNESIKRLELIQIYALNQVDQALLLNYYDQMFYVSFDLVILMKL